jgi:hypothetical protein
MLQSGQFDDEEPFHVIAAFVMQEVEDANVGEVTVAIAALAESNEQNGIVIARAQKSFRETDSPDMTVEAAVRCSVSEGNRQPIMFSRLGSGLNQVKAIEQKMSNLLAGLAQRKSTNFATETGLNIGHGSAKPYPLGP